ncbi:MAG TPA: PadR family transcriptional regulator [Geminicoccaceae bacterium]|nr:PadR family transcriptional regulator [Geminicoccaceae bacterium]
MDVKTICLGVLSEHPMTGYEIKKVFEDAFRHFFFAGFGSIYPALAELSHAGLVTVESVEQEKRPDKKVYRITEAGRRALQRELVATPPRHRLRSEFLVLMTFAHLLPPARIAQIIDQMVAQWERTLEEDILTVERAAAEPDACPLTPGQSFALGFGRHMLTAALAYAKRQKPALLREIEDARGSPAAAAE